MPPEKPLVSGQGALARGMNGRDFLSFFADPGGRDE
jgi:hypothetical protein